MSDTWKCEKCDEKFDTEKELNDHREDPDLCPECCAILDDIKELHGLECESCGWKNSY